ncbi:MAG: hypothetical protein ACLFSV_12115 [Alkalispirochaeta sp.]
MKRTIFFVIVAATIVGTVGAQSGQDTPGLLESPQAFRESIDLRTSLYELNLAVEDIALLEELAGRALILEGTAAVVTVYSEDPADYYSELEIVSGRWDGVESVQIYRAYVFLDDPVFIGRIAERAPRDPDPALILRNDRVLVAGRLVSLAEDPEGHLVPVIHGYDIRALR